MTSSPKDDQKIKSTCHGKGRLGFKQLGNDNEAQVYHYERLLTDRIYSVSAASDTETLKSQRLYSMFSRIVNYGAILKGITSITLAGREAVAEVDVPPKDLYRVPCIFINLLDGSSKGRKPDWSRYATAEILIPAC